MQDQNCWRQRLSEKKREEDRGKHKCFSYSTFYGHLWMQNVVLEKILEVNRITFLFLNSERARNLSLTTNQPITVALRPLILGNLC